MKNFLFKNKFLTTAFFKKTKLSLFLLCFVIPMLSHATQEREGLFSKIKNSIHRMINGDSVKIHQDFNNSEVAQQVNLNTQSFNNDTSSIKTTNLKATNQKPKKQPTLHNQQTNKETTNSKSTLHNQQTNKEATKPDLKKQNYPFFWQIERDGKKSYILGTTHRDIKLEDLPYHEEIKRHLRSADLLLPEMTREDGKKLQDYINSNDWIDDNLRRVYEQEDTLTENKTTNELMNIIRNTMTGLWTNNSFSSLSEQEQNFLLNLYNNHPRKEFIPDLSSMIPPQIEEFIVSTVPHARFSLRPTNDFLDLIVQDYFVQHNGHIAITSLDDLRDFSLMHTAKYLSVTIKDVKDFIENYSERFSDETIAQQKNHLLKEDKQHIELYLAGESDNRKGLAIKFLDREKGFLETELRQSTTKSIFEQDFRNPLWLPKIITAFEQHNSIFIVAGLNHFIWQERNPFNMPEFKEYTERNKNLPHNILDMLKNEGFKITRFGEGDFVPTNPCQRAFF